MSSFSNLPHSLLRYRPACNSYLPEELGNLANGKVWFRHLGGQNDDAEGVVPIVRSSEEKLRGLFKDLRVSAMKHLPPSHEFCRKYRSVKEFRAFLRDRRRWQKQFVRVAPERIRISCFSQPEKHDEQYMWRKYSSAGQGFRLHFTKESNCLKEDAPYWAQVFYCDNLDRKRVSEAELLAAEFHLTGVPVFDANPKQWMAILQAFSVCKTEEWLPEAETRLIKYSLKEDGYVQVPNYALTGVTFGSHASCMLIEQVRDALGEELNYEQASI
ncbi:DUF2971 domain-containing protein [Ruegeria sp.]|uniref:DUF2971 domain-containing protein n=1 Tax=Ruegeria sp. TaxID=1879320 RepID=UPI003AFF9A63